MDNFECSVKDLNDTETSNNSTPKKNKSIIRGKYRTENEDKNGNENQNENGNENGNKNENVNNFITHAFLNKMKETRSIRIILTVLIMYLILNSDQAGGLIFNIFPYLMNSATESNLLGKIIIALFIGVSVILSISFFPAP